MILTRTGARLSRLCFGTLTVSPLQQNWEAERAGDLFAYAYERGINCFDTAELYENYPHLKAMLGTGVPREAVALASKSYAYDRETLMSSVDRALEQIGTDYLDFFLMHEQESEHTVRGHWKALEALMRLKEQGVIRHIGLSTHFIAGVRAATRYAAYFDAVHPIINLAGLGIQDGKKEEMLGAIDAFRSEKSAQKRACWIYGMKVFGGGNLLKNADASFRYALSLPQLDGFAIGMSSNAEVDYNTEFVNRKGDVSAELPPFREKKLHIADWCIGCGNCISRCNFEALSLVDGRAVVDHSRCVTCGYCSVACPEFCIKVY